VGAPLFYREVNLPFAEAVKDPSKIRWRFGSISSPQAPPVVLEHLPVCGNCHSFSSNGGVLGMDVDYANSKGSYVIAQTGPQMALSPDKIMTWDDYRREDGELTFGLLSQVSPDGRRVVSTVKDKSVFVPRPDLFFSQLFFPIKGILAIYDRETHAFASLPGADDPKYVQSNPVWSPDGRYLLFARTEAYNMSATAGQGKVLLTPDECREFLKDGKPFRYDIYRIPYNDGKGGKAEPLEGASGNDRSNYFPRYSPDGKWVVFCQAANYMLLQPDSLLYIVPATGGQPRRLRANTPRMNSWHTWSPNSRWLVFSSKANSAYTQLFLTHIDDHGESTPPVCLSHMTSPDRAANIPEFVNIPPEGISKIQAQFLDDYSFERAANEFYRAGEPDRAIEKYRQALEINANNANAHQRLGFLLFNVKKQFREGLEHTAEAIRLDPKNSFAHCDMAAALINQNQPEQAIAHLKAALESLPPGTELQYNPQTVLFFLGQACAQLNRFPEAATHLKKAVRLDPSHARAHYLLALVLASQGLAAEAVEYYEKAVTLQPAIDSSVNLHTLLADIYARAGRFEDAVRSAERALQLARKAGKQDAAKEITARLERYKSATLQQPGKAD
jgi:tetratricopeptide (TPR) repeat protein